MIKKIISDRLTIGLCAVFLITRLYNLLVLPIFTDEAIYLYWGKFISTENSHWFIALTDGKSPLLTLIYAFFFKIFPNDWYLIIGRVPSVVFGLMTLVGIYYVSIELFVKKEIAFISALLYIINPFSLLYDRMALYDSQLTAMLIWSVYFCIKTSKSLSFKDASLWGLFLGLGFLSKPPAVLFLAITPIVFLILMYPKKIIDSWRKVLILLIMVLLISQGFNNIQRISGAYQQALLKNQQFQQPIEELLKDPFRLTIGNLRLFLSWLDAYFSKIFLIFGFVSFFISIIIKKKQGIILFLLWSFPVVVLATAGREVFPRYLVFITPYIIIPTSFVIYRIGNLISKKYGLIVSGVLVVLLTYSQIRFSLFLLTDPVKAPMPHADYGQLISEHPSGYGLKKVFDYLSVVSKNEKIVLVTHGTFGLYPYAFYLEFWENPNIRIIPRWPLVIDEEIYSASKDRKVFVLLKEHKSIPQDLPLDLVMTSEKPGNEFPLLLTKLRNPK